MSAEDTGPVAGFEAALDGLDFDGALSIANRADPPVKQEMVDRVRTGRAEATDRAEKLAARIQFLARADHYEGLLALADDPATETLLALLSAELRRGATLHLEGAVRRQTRFRAAAERHMKAAGQALLLLDTAKAVSELDKVEARWLTKEQRSELSQLQDQTRQAVAERRELEDRTAAVLREHAPDASGGAAAVGKSPAKARRTRSGSCLGTLLIAVAVLTLTVAALVR